MTVALAAHARLRLIPTLSSDTLPRLAWHIRLVTLVSVLFVVVGATIRYGGAAPRLNAVGPSPLAVSSPAE